MAQDPKKLPQGQPQEQAPLDMYAGSGTFDTYLDYMDSMYGPETSDADLNAVQYYQNILGADIFEQPAQPAAPAIAGVQPAQEQGGTLLDDFMAAGENFGGSFGRTVKSMVTGIPRLMFDYAVNRNVPFTEVDDELRRRIDAEAARLGVSRDVLQNQLWKNIEPEAASYLPGMSDFLGITDRLDKRFARRPQEQQNTVIANVAGGVGSFLPTLPVAFIPGGAGLAAGAALYSAQGGYEAYGQARDEGASFEDALVGGAIGAVPGAASGVAARLLVAQRMFAGWNNASGGKIEKMADAINRNVLTRLGSAGAVEGASEILDELFIKAGVAYATDQDLLELENLEKDLAKSGEVGAQTGIAIRAIIEGIIAGRSRGSKGLSPTINDKPIFNEETGEPLPRAPVAVSPVAAESLGRGAATPFGPVQSRTIVDKYVQQATQQPDLLPIDTPVNEMAAIIAAEEGIDIGIATATARAVRERLDVTDRQNRPPQLTNYTKVDPVDPRTWSEGMDEEAARKEYNDGLRRFVADYKAYEEAQKAAQAQEVRQRQAMGGRGVTDKERKELRADINRKYTELAAQGERDVGEAQRTYLREVYVEELIAANRPALMAGNPTESEYQRRVRSLIAQDNSRPEMRDTPEAQRDAEFYKEKLLESYRQREELDAAELAQLEADYQVELDQIAAELQARQQEFLAGVERLTEAEAPARKEEMQQLKDYLGLLKREAVRRQKGVRSLMKQRKEAEQVAQFEMEQAQAQFGPEAESPERKSQMGQLRDYFSRLEVEYERLSKGYAEAAKQRKLTIEQAETAQKELNELFTGGMETAERDAKLKEMEADFLKKYGTMEGAPVRTEEQEAAYAEFEAARSGLVQAFETATDDAKKARDDIEAINFNISSIQKEIRAELAAGNPARIKELQGTLKQAQDLLKQKQKEETEATKRVREARDNLQRDPNYIASDREGEIAPERSIEPTAASVTVAPSAPPRIASFFSGMGTVEAMLGKVSHVLAVEHEQDIVDAYNEAHGTKFQSASVFDINIDDVKDANPDLFHASPVCKEFSVAKFGQRNPDVDEVRSAQQIAKVIREVQPPAVTIENVPGYNDFPPFQNIVSALKEAGYKYRILIVDAADYGAAQRRERLIVQAVRSGELPPVPEKTGPADWYEQTKDLLASAEESPMGPDELARIKSMIQKGTLDGTKPIITMGGSAFKGKANASNSGGPAPTLPASPNQVVRVLFPDGRTVRVPSRALARLQGLPDLLTLPARATTAKKVLGNGVHGVITEKFIRPLLPASGRSEAKPVAPVTLQDKDRPVPAAKNKYALTDKDAGVMLARSMPEVYGSANQQRRNGLQRALQVVAEPGREYVTIDDVLNVIPGKKDEKLQDRRLRVQEYLATLVQGGLIQPVDGGGQRTYHLTLATAESLRKEATPPAPTPQVQAAPAAAAAKPPVVLEFKTGPQKGIWLEVYGRIQDLPDNEDVVEQYGQDVINELVALDDAANSISVSNKAADLLRELFDDARSMIEGAIQSKIYEHGTDNSGKPVTRQKIEAEYRIYEKYLEQLDRALNAPSAPPSGPVFGRPGAQPAIGKVQRIGPEAVVGQPAPGKTPYQYRIEAALKASVNAMDMDFVAPEARLEVGVATQQTIDNIERASDQQLLQMIDSSQPLGLQAVADVTEMDRFGQPIVKSVKVEVRALDKKITTAVQWMAQRVLAAGELRRRAALAALNADVKRSEAARGAPSTPGGKFGRPRQFYDATTGKEMPADVRRGQPIIDLQDSPGNEGFGLTGTIEDTLDKPQGEPVNKLQLRDAVRQVADIVQAPLLVANMSGKPMVGTYDPRRNMIAVQSSFNFVASLHEVGHGIVATLFGAGDAGPRNLDDVMPPTVRAEMERLGRTIYGTTVPEGGYMHEGVAEFTAGYVLRPERYNRQYPATAAWYQDMLNKQPELARAMGNAQDLFSSYRFQGSEARQRATRVDRENPTNKNTVQRIYDRMRDVFKMETLERRFTNSMVSLANMDREKVKRIKTLYARAGKTLNDADLLEMLKSGKLADYGEAIIAKNQQLLQTWLTTAMTDGNGNIRPGSKSMLAVLSPLRAAAKRIGTEEHMRDFEAYLAAKRELALLESGRITVAPTGIVDMRDSIARIEARYGDAIKLTYADYMQWWSGALQYVKDNDPFLAKVFDKIEEVERKYSTSGTYVPLQRIAFDLAVGQGVKASLADAFDMQVMEAGAKPIAGSRVTGGALVGSPSPRFDVLQTAESSLQALLTMTHKRMLTRAVVNAGTVFDMKSYAYEIPIEDQPDLSTTSAAGNDAIGLLKAGDLDMVAGMAVVAEGKSVNADGRIIVDLVDLVEIPGEVEVDLDGNPVLDEDGNPKPATKTVRRRFSLDENVVHAIATVDPHEVGRSTKSLFVLKKILQLSSRTFKTFATGVNVSFQILAAPVMDFGTTFLNGTQPYCGLRMPLDFTYTMGRLALAEANVRYEPYEQYKALSGGFDSGWGSVQKNATIEAIGRSRRQKIIDLSKSVFTPWNGEIYALLERTLSFSSRTGRILEMKQALKQAGYSGTGPLSQEQAAAAITALRRVTTNWSLTGTTVGELNQIIPYFSVSFVTMRDYIRSANKQMSNPSTRVQYAIKTGALLGAAAAYWAMAHDDENEAMKEAYANASYEDRMRYWIFGYKSEDGTNEVVRIPNPMTEFLPAKMVQAALDGMYSSDPYATGNWLKTIITNFMPGLMPAPAAAAVESMWNKNDLNKAIMDATFNVLGVSSTPSATPLESSYGRGPAQERVTPYTSSAGALLSEILNGQASPRQMDQMLESFLAGAPDQVQSMLEMTGLATSNKPVAVQQAPGFNTLSPVSRFISKTGPYSMRSPKIQELSAALEAARKLKESTRVPETPLMALELRALEDAFGCVTALHYIANYHPTMSREQRQKLQKFAVEIAVDATGKVQRGAIAEDYQRWDPLSRGLKQQRELIQNEALAQKPGYYPSIDWSKLLR
jgi:DNA (cytosine-5)-methyltransferase 1